MVYNWSNAKQAYQSNQKAVSTVDGPQAKPQTAIATYENFDTAYKKGVNAVDRTEHGIGIFMNIDRYFLFLFLRVKSPLTSPMILLTTLSH
jgi:hypothetical protein